MSSSLTSLTTAQLRRAADIKDKIDSLNGELASLLGGQTKPRGKRRGMSAAGRARVAAAQRARWAKIKAKKVKA